MTLANIGAGTCEIYEKKHYSIEPPSLIEAIKFRMGQQGLSAKGLELAIGKSNHVYEILNGKHALTLPMIRRLHTQLGIPLESLVGA